MKTHLVVLRCGMDDIPTRFFQSREAAVEFIREFPESEVRRIEKVLNVDVTVFHNLSIYTFEDGWFTAFEVVRDFDEEGENAPEWAT